MTCNLYITYNLQLIALQKIAQLLFMQIMHWNL